MWSPGDSRQARWSPFLPFESCEVKVTLSMSDLRGWTSRRASHLSGGREQTKELFCRDSHRCTTEPGSCIRLCGRLPFCNERDKLIPPGNEGHRSETEALPLLWGSRGPVLGLTSKGTIRNIPHSHKAAMNASFPGSSKMFLQRNALD